MARSLHKLGTEELTGELSMVMGNATERPTEKLSPHLSAASVPSPGLYHPSRYSVVLKPWTSILCGLAICYPVRGGSWL